MYRPPLVSPDFEVPLFLKHKDFILKPLTIDLNEKDFLAVTKQVDKQGNLVAPTNLTSQQNLVDIAWHQKEFQKRSSFAYSILKADERDSLGCVYIFPSDNSEYQAGVTFWITKDAFDQNLALVIEQEVKKWLKDKWSFDGVLFEYN